MDERELRERWVATWASAGPELEAIKWREMVEADPAETLRLLAPAFAYALRALPVRTTSGMGEMQALFAKLRGLVFLRQLRRCSSSVNRKVGVVVLLGEWQFCVGESRGLPGMWI